SGSMTTSSGLMPWSPAAETIFLAISSRASGSISIVSPFASPITAAPCLATSGRIASSRSSSAVTELTSALPSYADRPASSASTMDESMQIGRSVSSCTIGIAFAISPTSSARGAAPLTSSMPAVAVCCATSVSICDRSSACSCAWNPFRPVGLIRSPMMQNGCSGPMTTVLDRDWRTVSTCFPFGAGRDVEARAQSCDTRLAAEADQVEPGDAGERPRVRGELAAELEALGLGIGRALAALDHLRRDRDAGHVLVDEAQRPRRAHEADRGDQRGLVRESALHRLGHEPLEELRVEADLQLEEARAGS